MITVIKSGKVRKDEMGRECSMYWEKMSAYRIFVETQKEGDH
jgi:hypothetical protein